MEATEAWQKGEESVQKGSSIIFSTVLDALTMSKGALIGRHGTIELTTVLLYLNDHNLDPNKLAILERNAGVFPKSGESVKAWIEAYQDATADADVMAAGWYAPLAKSELAYLANKAPQAKLVPLRSLEPYYVSELHNWMRAFEGHRVTVVSSFANTMKHQFNKAKYIWPKKQGLLSSDVKWSFVRSYYSPSLARGRCHWPDDVKSWKEAVDLLEKKVLEKKPRICLIGCGGLAMPLAKRLKDKGIIAIVMGGAIQILFGIKGRRWDFHSVISSFYNNNWVYPSQDEVPNGAKEIEGGCYW